MRQNQQRSSKSNNNTKKGSRSAFVKVRKSGKGERAKSDKQQQRCKKPITLDPQYALSQAEFTDLVKCNFNLPRISAALERLIGTNVVRLTDHKFMSELRKRLEEEHRNQLERRITARALREVERERLLIIEGKTDEIPEELADDPIFVVNKIANKEIQKERAKLKTNRERNAERLKAQGSKWERERQKYVEEEQQRVENIKERNKAQNELEDRYKTEDAERGMDLLRIDNEEWRECEQELKRFLEEERAKMKERSLRVPTPFTSDKLDIINIVRARKKFREAEQRIVKQLEEGAKQTPKATDTKLGKELAEKTAVIQKHVQDIIQAEAEGAVESEGKEVIRELSDREKEEQQSRKYLDDASDISTESEVHERGSTISESKRRHAAELEDEMEFDVERGYLISKTQFEQLRYQDNKILQLQQASDMRELYQLAEEIIIGERLQEEEVEEEMVEEEEQPIGEEEEGEEEAEPADNNF
ncbi:golgin subfamily A member 6-like protein 22 [Rhagoletis pomonella]|uniref:golgin subfamily A member 6-like protein 22 n=1 Tax=Rhagoletis pomonella TaxID=28610 RepID=UPI00177D8A10|nr:golgin subfamily A member 6-like protein 22 [Rhagoletis pomonella]